MTVVSLLRMADPKQVPELAAELFEMSKQYLRQETIEPAKRLGRYAGMGVAGAVAFALAAVFLVTALYSLLQLVLPASAWYNVLARGITTVAAGVVAGVIIWRMGADGSAE